MENSDFFTFWGGGRLLGTGQNPYNAADWLAVHQNAGSSWLENPTFVYPLPVAVLFSPLARLSVASAAKIWIVISQVFILFSIFLLIRTFHWKRAVIFIPFILIGVAFFRPTLVTLINGQISSLLLLSTTASLFFWSRKQWFWGGAIIGLLTLKPTGAIIFLPTIGFWLVMRQSWRALAGLAITITALWSLGAAFQPDWLTTWIGIGLSKVTATWEYTVPPTSWGFVALMTHFTPGWTVYAGILTAAIMITSLVFTLHSASSEQWILIGGVVMPLAIATTPYLWNYDHILLLIPLFTILTLIDKLGKPFFLIALLPIAFGIPAIALLILAGYLGHDAWGWIFPVMVAGITGWLFYSYSKNSSPDPIGL